MPDPSAIPHFEGFVARVVLWRAILVSLWELPEPQGQGGGPDVKYAWLHLQINVGRELRPLRDTWISLERAQVRAECGSRGRGSGSEVCPGQPEEEEVGWLPERSLQRLL